MSSNLSVDKPALKQTQRPRLYAVLALAVGMVSVQVGSSVAKGVFPRIGPQSITALRLGLAAAILCAIRRPWRHRLTWPQRRAILAYGVVLGGMNLTFYLALARIPLGIAVALEFIGPLAVALLASRRPSDIVWVLLAAVGFIGLIPRGVSSTALDLVGVLFALAAGVCWGGYIILGQRAGATVPGGVASALGMLTAACVVWPLCVWQMDRTVFTPPVLSIAIAVAVLSSVIPYSLEMMALQRLPIKTFSILMSLEPAIGACAGLVVLHERLLVLQWCGILCVIVASIGGVATAVHPAAVVELAD